MTYTCIQMHLSLSLSIYIYIYICVHVVRKIFGQKSELKHIRTTSRASEGRLPGLCNNSNDNTNNNIRDKNLYTTTNKCLQCLIKLMYTVL